MGKHTGGPEPVGRRPRLRGAVAALGRNLVGKMSPLHGPLILGTQILHDSHLLSSKTAKSLIGLARDDEARRVRRRVRFAREKVLLLELPVALGDARDLLFGDIYTHPREGTSYSVFAALAGEANSICDVGAHVGVYTYLAACLSDPATSHVVSFEPQPTLSAVVERNVALNALSHVHVEQAAVGEKSGRALLYVATSADYSSLSREWAAGVGLTGTLSVNLWSLDEYFRTSELPTPDLVKIDVEQHEVSVFQGMADIIARRQPNIIVELLGESRRAGIIDTAIETWGYDVYYIAHELQRMERDDGRYQHPFYNFLFTTREPAELAATIPLPVVS